MTRLETNAKHQEEERNGLQQCNSTNLGYRVNENSGTRREKIWLHDDSINGQLLFKTFSAFTEPESTQQFYGNLRTSKLLFNSFLSNAQSETTYGITLLESTLAFFQRPALALSDTSHRRIMSENRTVSLLRGHRLGVDGSTPRRGMEFFFATAIRLPLESQQAFHIQWAPSTLPQNTKRSERQTLISIMC